MNYIDFISCSLSRSCPESFLQLFSLTRMTFVKCRVILTTHFARHRFCTSEDLPIKIPTDLDCTILFVSGMQSRSSSAASGFIYSCNLVLSDVDDDIKVTMKSDTETKLGWIHCTTQVGLILQQHYSYTVTSVLLVTSCHGGQSTIPKVVHWEASQGQLSLAQVLSSVLLSQMGRCLTPPLSFRLRTPLVW